MTKRILSMALALCVCLTMLVPAGVWADNTGGIADKVKTVSNENSEKGISLFSTDVAEVTIDGTATKYADIDAAFTAAQEADSADVKLLQNVTMQKEYSYGIRLKTGNITLDLNGCSLSTTDYDSFVPLGSIFYMEGGSLTINDNSNNSSGKIVQPNAGPAVYVYSDSTLIINRGTIENTSEKEANRDNYKCAVFVNGGDVTINGGTIGTGGSAGDGLSYVAGTAILNGGTFKKVEIIKNFRRQDINQNVTVSNLLGAGRSYRYADGSSPDSYDVDALDNVSVVEGKIPIKYQRYDETFVFKSASVDKYTDVTAETTDWTEDVYVVTGDVNITGDVTVTGKTELILRDGASLTVNGCLSLASNEGSKGLTIYGQADQTGTMSITNDNGYALNFSDGTGNINLYVYGGSFSAAGSPFAISSNNTGISVIANGATGWKYVADGKAVTSGFDFKDKQSVTVGKCTHDEWYYFYDDDLNSDKHYKVCRLCGSSFEEKAHSASRGNSNGESGHTEYCVCGKETGTAAHDTEVVVNDDGLTHKTACKLCSYTAAEETHNFENGRCTVCGANLAAEYDGRKYTSLQKAIDDAAKGGTVTLAADEIAENVTVTGGNIIIDLNGKEWMADISNSSSCIPLTVDGGSVTLKNGKIYQRKSGSSAQSAIVVKSGGLTVEGDVSVMGGTSGTEVVCYSVSLQGGSLTLKQGAALLSGLQVPEDSKLADYLPAGTAFVKCTYEYAGDKIAVSDEYVSGVYTTNKTSEGMAIVEHKHNCTADKKYTCDCGYVCTHKTFENGLCTVCGYACPHISMNADGVCGKCHVELTASVTDINGKTSYYADGYYPNTYNTRSGLDFAFEAAASGSTVTVLGGSSPTAWLNNGKELTLELNGKSVRDIYVGRDNSINSLTIKGVGAIGTVYVHANNTVDLTGWSDEMEKLYVYNGGKVTLNGGTFGNVTLNGNTAGSLLAPGYAFQCANESYVKYTATDNLDTVTVVRCNIHHVDSETGHCDYCDEAFVARMGDTHYFYTLGFALDIAAEDGSTVTLLANVNQNATFNGGDNPVTLEMNGKTLTAEDNSRPALTVSAGTLTVSGDGKINTLNVGKGKLNVSGNNVEVGSLNVSEGGKASLAGGKYSSITAAEGVELKDFLAAGMKYWSRNSNNEETFIEGDTNSITNAGTIVIHACEHQWVFPDHCSICGDTHIHTAPNDEGKCDICGLVIEAEVGGVYYTELYYAMEAASKMDNKPVVLMYADSHPLNTSGVCTVPDGDYTINTNGKSIEVRMLSINGKLNITGGGTIDSEIWINDTLTLMNEIVTGPVTVNYSEESSISGSLTANFSQINGKLTVKGGKAEINSTELKGGILVEGGNVSAADLGTKISGAEVTGGSMTIAQGKIEGENGLTLKGGTVNVRDYAYISKITEDGGALDISGGTIGDLTVNSGDARLAGGKYINGITLADGLNYADILADGYAFKDSDGNLLKPGDAAAAGNLTVGECTNSTEADSEGRCPYCGLQFAAEAGGTKYTTIAAALNADSNVKLIADADINEQLVISADGAVIDLNGKTVNCDVIGDAILVSGGTLIIRDSSQSGSGQIIDRCNETSAGICVSGGSLTIEGGTYEASGDYSTAVKQTGGSLEIKGGTFTVGNSETSYAVQLEGGTSFKVSGSAELKAGRANTGRCLFIDKAYKGGVSLAGGNYTDICIEEGGTVTLGELLADGYGFKKGAGKWVTETELAGTAIENVTVTEVPIKNIEVTAVISSVTYGYLEGLAPMLQCRILGIGEAVTGAQYQWYEVTENGETPVGSDSYLYTIVTGKTVGTYTYYCTASYDGYTVTGNTAAVTVKPAGISDAEITVNQVSYNGNAHNAADVITVKTNVGSSNEKTLTAGTDFEITGDTSGTDAGKYSVCIEAKGNYTGKVNTEWTIDPAELTISSIEIAPKKYDGSTAAEITSVSFDGLMEGKTLEKGTDYTVTGVFNSANVNEADKVTATVKLAESVKNYRLADENFDKKASISKANAECDAPTAKELTYTGAAQELVTAGKTSDGKIMYSLNREGTYTEDIPTGTAAANYTVWYKVEGDSNHNDTEASSVDVTIAKADAACDVPVAKELTYTGAEQELVTEGSTNDGKLVYSIEQDGTYSSDIPTGVNAGDYKVWYKVEGDSNHKDSEPASVEVKIERRSITPKDFVVADKTYDGSTDAEITSVVFDNLVTGETLEIGKDYTVTGEFNSADVNDANKVTAAVKLADSVKNYRLAEETLDKAATIARAESQCTAPAANELTYSGEAQELVKAGSTNDGSMVYSLSETGEYTEEIPTAVNAGDYDVWYKVIGDDNHNDSNPVSVKVTVNRADAVFEAPAAVTGLEYTGEAQELVTAGSTEHGDMVYSLEKEDTYSSEIPTGVNAGTYNVWYKVAGDSNHKDSEPAYVEVGIARATPTGEPAYDRIGESGKTLADANIAVKDKDGRDKFSVAGTVKWESDDTTEVKQGSKYKWVFTPESGNYNTITGEVTLWPYYSGGGAAEDVITIEDKTSSETATITTVKDTRTETVKNEQGEEISKVTATVSEKVAEKLVDQAVSNKSDTVEITVKSDGGNKADGEKQIELEIPKSAVESIAKDTEADLVIKTDSGQVVLDNRTLETIAAEAEGDTVRIVVNENTQLKEDQKPAADVIGKNGKLFDIKAVIGDRIIHDLKGGRAHVTLPMPEKLKGKDIVIIYISDKGICEILNHTVETVGAEEYIRFTTSHFSNFAVVEKADAEKIIEQQNADKIKSLVKEVKLKAATSKTSKKNVKIKVSVKNSNSLIKEAKAMGYTVKYKFYKSTKKASKYKAVKTKTSKSYINTKGKKGTKYYYKAKVLVYDGKTLIAQTSLKQCSYGVRSWSK